MPRLRLVLLAILLLVPARLHAQWPPAGTKNIKQLPADISVHSLVDTMKGFTRALGVRCTYCHLGSEADGLDKYDFVSDDKPAKVKAREMLAMVKAINSEYLTRISDRRQPQLAVTCITCHRGVAVPRPVDQIVLGAYDAAGVDSALNTYRSLRTRYYGRASYDFGEVPLVDVADVISQRGKLSDALRFYQMNTELLPNSTFALRSAAGGYLKLGDTTSAIAAYEKAVSINARDQQSIDALKDLRKGH